MKDDIKQILDKLRSDDYYEKEYQKSVYYERDLKKLEDYITNLQEENERLKDYYNDNVNNYEELLEKYSTIQILYNSSKSSIDETVKYLKIQIDDYKEELQKTDDEDVKLFCIHKIDTYNELLKILQGGDE